MEAQLFLISKLEPLMKRIEAERNAPIPARLDKIMVSILIATTYRHGDDPDDTRIRLVSLLKVLLRKIKDNVDMDNWESYVVLQTLRVYGF